MAPGQRLALQLARQAGGDRDRRPARLGVTNRGCPALRRQGILGPYRDTPVGSPAAGAPPPIVQRAMAPDDAGAPVTSASFPRHARRPGVARWAARRAKPAPVRVLADGDRQAWQPAVRFDPLSDPVAITGHCVIGDQILVPAAWCAMAQCRAVFAEPAALGEADNRARAGAAGWATDALGRLACPACQRDHPAPPWWLPTREPGTAADHGPGAGTARPAGRTNQSVRPTVWGPPAAAQGRPHRTHWPRLLSALVSSRDGRTARAASPIPDPGTHAGPGPDPAPRHGQAAHAAGSARRRARTCRPAVTAGG
jgi:hypothetical protein